MSKVKPKIVFIDTEQFDACNLSFSHANFTRLADLVEVGQVRVLLTDVVVGEVRRHIRQKLQEAKKKLGQQFGGLFQNLIKTPQPQVFSSEYWSKAEAEVMAGFLNCCEKLKAETVPILPELVNIVFAWYFNHEAPFDSQKRKAEFPDAFSIAAINEWAKEHKEHVYVVSNDAAFSIASQLPLNAPQLTHKDSLAAFFELFPDPALATAVKGAFVAFLKDEANGEFGEREFQRLAFYVEEVESMEVDSVHLLYTEPYRLHVVEAKGGHAVLVGRLYVHFMAEIRGIPDWSDDQTAFAAAEIQVDYDENDPTKIQVKSIEYDQQWAIEVSLPYSYRRSRESE